MAKKSNWSPVEDKLLRELLADGSPLSDIALALQRTEDAVYLYCYRHHIPLRPRLKNPMMRRLLQIKFGDPDFFHPNKAFFSSSGINQKRWSDLAWGYTQPTQDELMRVAKILNFSIDEAFQLMESRQLNLFDDL